MPLHLRQKGSLVKLFHLVVLAPKQSQITGWNVGLLLGDGRLCEGAGFLEEVDDEGQILVVKVEGFFFLFIEKISLF